jgi:hypothetical protein
MRKETVEVDSRFGEEYAGRYVFSEITWAKRSRIIQKHTKYHPVTGQVVSSDYVAVQAESIWASLKEQPADKPITLEKLLSEDEGIPIEIGELFSQIVNKLCSVTLEDARFLSEPSEEENRIQLSQDSDCAKNSASCQAKSEENQPKTLKNSS